MKHEYVFSHYSAYHDCAHGCDPSLPDDVVLAPVRQYEYVCAPKQINGLSYKIILNASSKFGKQLQNY
jgi:hypothetical protein